MTQIKKCLDDACTQFVLYEDGSVDIIPKDDCDKNFKPKEGFGTDLRGMIAEMLTKGGKMNFVSSTKKTKKPESKPDPKSKPKADPVPGSESKPEPKTEPEPAPKSEIKSKPKTESKPEPEPDPKE